MTRAALRERIVRYACTGLYPVLEEADVDDLADRAGFSGEDEGSADYADERRAAWAVAKAWSLKAGKASGAYDFTAGGDEFKRSQAYKQCQEETRRWTRIYRRATAGGSVGEFTSPDTTELED